MKKLFSLLFAKEIMLLEVLLCLFFLGGFLAISCGSWQIETDHVFKVLLMKMGLFSGKVSEVEATIVWDGRMPRFIVAFLVGFSLAAAGCAPLMGKARPADPGTARRRAAGRSQGPPSARRPGASRTRPP